MGNETVRVDVFNYGSNMSVAAFDVIYQLDTNTAVSQAQVFTNFTTNSTQTITFTIPANFTDSYGGHNLVVFTNLTTDVDRSNDTLSIELINYEPSSGGSLVDDDTVCQSQNSGTLYLTDQVGDIQRWEKNDGSGWSPIVHTDTSYSYQNLLSTHRFRVQTKNGLCSPAYSNEVTISTQSPTEAGTLEKDRAVCQGGQGDTLLLKGYDGTISTWQLDTGTGWWDNMHRSDTLIYPAPTKNTRYRVVVEKSICPADTSNIVAVTIITATNGGTITPSVSSVCGGDNHDTLRLRSVVGNVQEWQYSDDDEFTWSPIINNDTIQIYNNLTSDRSYRVKVESNGCPSSFSDTARVQVTDPVKGGEVWRDKSICGGTNKDTLLLLNYTGNIIKWQRDSGNGWADISNTQSKDTLFVFGIFKTTQYRAITGNGICADDTSTTATLTVISTTYGGTIHKSDSICQGQNQGTLALKDHIGDIRWWERSTDRGVNWTPISNRDTVQRFVDVNQTTWYRVLIEGRNCPSDYSDTAILTTYTPKVQITPNGPIAFCFGDSVDLAATLGYETYTWSTGSSNDQITVYDSGMYKVVITDKRSCSSSDSILVNVYQLPTADAGSDQVISLGASTKLTGKGGIHFLWTPSETLTDSTIADPFATPWVTTTYTLTVMDEHGCKDDDEVEISVLRDYNVTGKNLITPNGDGINDTWKIDNILPYTESTVTIINRYGQVVYERTGYDNSWDGSDGDQTVSDGTYYYVVQFKDNNTVVKGHITVLSK
mgnify:CR=1 FL=1